MTPGSSAPGPSISDRTWNWIKIEPSHYKVRLTVLELMFLLIMHLQTVATSVKPNPTESPRTSLKHKFIDTYCRLLGYLAKVMLSAGLPRSMRQLSRRDTRAVLSPGARLAERPLLGVFPASSLLSPLSTGVTNPFVEACLEPFDVFLPCS